MYVCKACPDPCADANYFAIWNNNYTYNGDKLGKFIMTGQPRCDGDDGCRQVRPNVGVTFFNGIRYSDMGIVFDSNGNPADLGWNIDLVYDMVQVYIAAIQLDVGHYMSNNVSFQYQHISSLTDATPTSSSSTAPPSKPRSTPPTSTRTSTTQP